MVSHVSETGESLGPSIQNGGGVVLVHRPLEIRRVAISEMEVWEGTLTRELA